MSYHPTIQRQLSYVAGELGVDEEQVVANAIAYYYDRLKHEDAGWHVGFVSPGIFAPRMGGVYEKIRSYYDEDYEDDEVY